MTILIFMHLPLYPGTLRCPFNVNVVEPRSGIYIYINTFIYAVFAASPLNGRLRDNHNRFFIVREAVDVCRFFLTLQSVV